VSRPPHVWELSSHPDETPLADPLGWLIASSEKRRTGPAEPLPPVIRDGAWHKTMVSAAGTMRRRGFSEPAAVAALVAENAGKYNGTEPANEAEIVELVADVYGRYDAGETLDVQRGYAGPSRALDEVVDTFQAHLHLPDPAPLVLTLAAVVANLGMDEGDPVWTVNVGGSSRGKTEIVSALDGFPGVRVIGALTVAALLSGTSRKDRAKNATGGILHELGDQGILVVKDFGAILTLHREARAQVLQALRDVYDGLYTRDVGADGGTKLRWTGRVGLIAGATSALDSAHAVLSALGERWVTVRLPESGEGEMAKVALRNTDTRAARAELREAVHGFLAPLENVPLRPVTDDEESLLVALASLVCLARSPVERDPYKRDIVYIHSPEGPARIVGSCTSCSSRSKRWASRRRQRRSCAPGSTRYPRHGETCSSIYSSTGRCQRAA
jgi:hypothetical protein